ncbi:putative carboxylesterase [Helianthus annuus]|nr:putative carboxylesterase [Helianthus annuus]
MRNSKALTSFSQKSTLHSLLTKLLLSCFNSLVTTSKSSRISYICINTSLIITGSGLGRYLAILSNLRLHHAIYVEELNGFKETKRPICITFRCPLVGDVAIQQSGGHTAFEDQDSIMPILDLMRSSNTCNLQIYDYTNILSSIRRKVLCRVSELGESNLNSLRAGITLQLREVCVLNDISNGQIGQMVKKKTEMIKRRIYECL